MCLIIASCDRESQWQVEWGVEWLTRTIEENVEVLSVMRSQIQIIREKKSNKVWYKIDEGGSRVALKTGISMTMQSVHRPDVRHVQEIVFISAVANSHM
jgi:hypothetical protein